jgi:hypothetical protein
MLLVRELTIPPMTLRTNPAFLVVEEGRLLNAVDVIFPEGCLYAVGIKISDNGQQIIPNHFGWLSDNNKTVTIHGPIKLSDARHLVLCGFSDASDWPHTITFRLDFSQ